MISFKKKSVDMQFLCTMIVDLNTFKMTRCASHDGPVIYIYNFDSAHSMEKWHKLGEKRKIEY